MNQGEGDYFCADAQDAMFRWDSEAQVLTPLRLKLFDLRGK